MTQESSPTPDIHVRATVAKFDGDAPTKVENAVRRAVLLGPRLPVEIITIDDTEGVSVDRPEARLWPMARFVSWFNKKRGK